MEQNTIVNDNINLTNETLPKRKSKRLLEKEFDNLIQKTFKKIQKNKQPYFLKKFLLENKNKITNQEYIYLHDMEIYIGNEIKKHNTNNIRNRDPKRNIAKYFNGKANGWWDQKHNRGKDKSKKYRFNPDINANIKRQTGGTYFKPEIKQKLLEQAKNRCELCGNSGTSKNLHADHWNNRSNGGNGTFENGVILCQQCNNRKKDKHPDKLALDHLKQIVVLNNRSGNKDTIDYLLNRIVKLLKN